MPECGIFVCDSERVLHAVYTGMQVVSGCYHYFH